MPTYMDLYNSTTGDTTTRSRVYVAVGKYARYVVGADPAAVPASRLEWAKAAIQNPHVAVEQIMLGVVGDPAYLAAGSQITDDALQSALEGAVNALYS